MIWKLDRDKLKISYKLRIVQKEGKFYVSEEDQTLVVTVLGPIDSHQKAFDVLNSIAANKQMLLMAAFGTVARYSETLNEVDLFIPEPEYTPYGRGPALLGLDDLCADTTRKQKKVKR